MQLPKMTSPFSQDIETMMNTITKSLDTTTKKAPVAGASATSSSTTPFVRLQIADEYRKYIIPGYIVLSILLAIGWSRHRASKEDKTSQKQKVTVMQVAMWTVVFNIPLIIWYMMRPKA